MDVPGGEPTLEQEIARIASVPLQSDPGKKCNYSLSIDVLDQVAAVATKQSLPAAVKELVTAPLGMKDTGFVVTDKERLTANYYAGKQGLVRITGHTELPLGASVVGLPRGTVSDELISASLNEKSLFDGRDFFTYSSI